MTIMVPKDEQELRDMLYTCTEYKDGPTAIRYPRGAGVGVPLAASGFKQLPIGQGEMMKDGNDLAIIGVGPLLYQAMQVAEDLDREGISTAVFNARFVKPIDEAMLEAIGLRFKNVLTIEENSVKGGFGSAVAEFFALKGYKSNIRIHGIPDEFIEHGSPAELMKDIGLDRAGIARIARDLVAQPNTAVKV
jgi:1-deoxy-D-xylulose-5-phosphate synthase